MDKASTEYAVGGPHPRLRPFVTEYIGCRLAGFEPGVHVGLPSGSLTFIVAFDDPLDLTTEFGSTNHDIFWGVLCGLHTKPAFVWHQGRQHGVQLAITPRGAAALFGIPACELASSTVHLGEVAPSIAAEMIERLSAAVSWPARWAVLDEIFLRTLRSDVEMPAELARAWSILSRTHGAVTVADLANEVGWSRRHFAQKFKLGYGLSPKAGAVVFAPLKDEDYGSRGFSVTDPEGNIWSFGTYRGE